MHKILIIGTGSIAKKHLETLRTSSKLSAKQISSRSLSNDRFYSEPDQENIELQGFTHVIFANPCTYRERILKRFVFSEANLFFEKPFAPDLKTCNRLIGILRGRTKKLAVGYNLRYLQHLEIIKKIVKRETYGKVLKMRCRVAQNLKTWRATHYTNTVSAQRKLGGGAVLELSHEIDYLLELFDELIVLSSNSGRLSSLNIDVEDSAEVILSGKNNSHHNALVSLSLDFVSQKTERYCQIICDKGTLEWDLLHGTIDLYENKSRRTRISKQKDPVSETYTRQMLDFLKDEFPTNNSGELDRCLAIANIVEHIRE